MDSPSLVKVKVRDLDALPVESFKKVEALNTIGYMGGVSLTATTEEKQLGKLTEIN